MVHINKFPSNCDLWIMWFANQSLQTSCPKRTLRFDMQSLMSNDACPSHYSMQGSVSERFSAEFGMTWFYQTCHGIQMYHTLFLFLFSFFWLITRLPTTPQTQLHTSQASYLLLVPDPPGFVLLPISKLSISAFASEKKNAIGVHFETPEPKLASSQVTDLRHTFNFQRWSNGSCFSPRRRSDIRLFSLHSDYE